MLIESERKKSLFTLGCYLVEYSPHKKGYEELDDVLKRAQAANGWYTAENLKTALRAWGEVLSMDNIDQWLAGYALNEPQKLKTIGLVLAGNIPLVGFHDLLCVWASGHNAQIKASSKDNILLPFIAKQLELFGKKKCFEFIDKPLKNIDAVIATGSNNSARYFEYYFSKIPSIVRKNRNGLAVLTGEESKHDFEQLGKDMLLYFGMGCRNVSKLLVPHNFDFNLIFGGLYPWASVIENAKYANNYDYNKAVFLMSDFDFLENGFFMLKQDTAMAAPIASAFYDYYDNTDELNQYLRNHNDAIQCIVGKNHTPFGSSQTPNLWEYADQVDTLAFLLSL